MTRDDIIRMAREAGASFETAESMFRFAELVSAAEREACAKLAEAEAQRTGDLGRGHEKAGRRVMMSRCYARSLQCTQLAADIRALGEKP